MNRRVILGLVILLVVAALAGPIAIAFGVGRSEAAFGDSETFGVNRIASASVSVEVGSNTLPVDTTLLAPGDRLAGQISFDNAGTLPLRYAVVAELSSRSGVSLLDVLWWRIWPARTADCSVIPGVSGLLFDGIMLDSAVLGDVAIGPDPGDRLVDPAESDVLCVVIELPIGISDAYQSAEAIVNLTLHAEQAPEEIR